MLVEQIPPHKESIAGYAINANQGIAPLVCKMAEGGQIRAPVLIRHMFFLAQKRGIVGHCDGALGSERLVVFHNKDGRSPLAKRFENVVVHTINIQGENAQLLVEAAFIQKSCNDAFEVSWCCQ